MKTERIRLGVLLIGAFALLMGCAKPIPYKSPVTGTPPSGSLKVAHAVNLLDASGSKRPVFQDGRATLESIVSVMPNGSYSAGNIGFGGFDRESTGMSSFNRSSLAAAAKNASFLGGATPIFDVLDEDVQGAIGGTSGRAAIILISDGLATDYVGRSGAEARTIAAAQDLAASRKGDTCFHTVQIGNDAAGAAFLGDLARATSCGSFRNASALNTAGALQRFSREVYLGKAKPMAPVSRPTDGDQDGDGVKDSADACPNTLRNARVDSRGCWTLRGVRFATNKADIRGGSETILNDALRVLQANPGVRIRVDGHTDSDGAASYNQGLSERRASAVRDYFVNKGGISADRLQVQGFGETKPVAPNDSRENKALNRRVELTIIN